MKILVAYRKHAVPEEMTSPDLLSALPTFPDSHQSRINVLLVMHWLREMGHEVAELVEHEARPWYFPLVCASDLDAGEWDMLLLWKAHSLRDWLPHLLRRPWRHVAAWLDCSRAAKQMHGLEDRVGTVFWGTQRLRASEGETMPRARHFVVEHATVFPSPPPLPLANPEGIFMGRVPLVYRQVVEQAAAYPMRVLALKVELPSGEMIKLRPGQYTDAEWKRVDIWAARHAIALEPAKNIIRFPPKDARFGLVASTRAGGLKQEQAACKCWDYWALGIPVVMADNVPETVHVFARPELGVLYHQGNDPTSLESAIATIGEETPDPREWYEARYRRMQSIQDWVFEHHTYRHRAAEIADGLASA